MSRGGLGPKDEVMVSREAGVYHKKLGCAISGSIDIGVGDIEKKMVNDVEDDGYNPCGSCVIGPWNGDCDRYWER